MIIESINVLVSGMICTKSGASTMVPRQTAFRFLPQRINEGSSTKGLAAHLHIARGMLAQVVLKVGHVTAAVNYGWVD